MVNQLLLQINGLKYNGTNFVCLIVGEEANLLYVLQLTKTFCGVKFFERFELSESSKPKYHKIF